MTRRDWLASTFLQPLTRYPVTDQTLVALPGVAMLRVEGTLPDGRVTVAMLPGAVKGWIVELDEQDRRYAKLQLISLTPEDVWGTDEVTFVSAEVLWDPCGVGRVATGELVCDGTVRAILPARVPTVRIPLAQQDVFPSMP
jgi:hypothetical protein